MTEDSPNQLNEEVREEGRRVGWSIIYSSNIYIYSSRYLWRVRISCVCLILKVSCLYTNDPTENIQT